MEHSLQKLYQKLDTRSPLDKMPVIFIGHGSPLNVINGSPFAETWKELGTHLQKPRAIVSISAHWLTDGIEISAVENPDTIYDFYGFPPALYAVEYPTKGSPSIAHEIASLAPESIVENHEYGLDHGTWTVLKHLFPHADIPVLQISIDIAHSRRDQYTVLQKLRSFREKGILFIGSGNIIHNLGQMQMTAPHDWAVAFDTLTKTLITDSDTDTLLDIENHSPLAGLAMPTDEHYRPMLNALALTEKNDEIHFFNEEIDLGAVGMRSFISL